MPNHPTIPARHPTPNVVFVRARKDSSGTFLNYYHSETGERTPVTEDGFILQSGCTCTPGEAFYTVKDFQLLLRAAMTVLTDTRTDPSSSSALIRF